MSSNLPGASVFRWCAAAAFALCVFGLKAQAQPVPAAKPDSITGVYNGSYAGEQGTIAFKLSITQQENGLLSGSFTLNLPDGSGTTPYTCEVRGRYIAVNRMVQVFRSRWETPPPAGVDMPGLNGVFDPAGGNGAGQISGRVRTRLGPQFQAVRDADETAKMAAAPAAPNPPAARGRPDTPPVRRVAAANGAAPAPPPPPPAPSPTPAPDAHSPTAINGVYLGEYKPSNETLKLKLSIKAADDGSLTALFTFDRPAQKVPSVTYKLTGKYSPKSHAYGLASSPFEFTSIEPVGSAAQEALASSRAQALHIGVTSPGSIVGSMTGSDPKSGEFNCGWITGKRDAAESADLDKVMLAQASGETAVVPVAPVVHRSFEGVYYGTYPAKDGQAIKIRMALWLQRENKTTGGQLVNTEIGGLLTQYVSEDAGIMPYTSELKGYYIDTNRIVQVTVVRWEPPPSGIFLPAGLQGKLEPGPGDGAAQISGYMGFLGNPKFQLVRNADESAGMDFDRLRKHIRPGLVGVFNGTYTRGDGEPLKFKLTITHNQDGAAGLAGLATIYLPVDGAVKAYSYDLKGIETAHGGFQLRVNDWVTPPPPSFENFRAMGFNGKITVNEALTAARIASESPPPGMASFYLPGFEAAYDGAESADIKGTLEAQKALGRAEQAAALKARAEAIKHAPPIKLASKDLVRKSRQYWEGYEHDMLREVFDGGFGAAIDENEEFQKTFCAYVETFAVKCPDFLPANHQTVTVTQKTNRKFDEYNNLISEDTQTTTIEMDPRFVAPYNRFYKSLTSRGNGLRLAIAAQSPGAAQAILNDLLSYASDMRKFFSDHGGGSASLRQLNENFLRAVADEASLQESDGRIDGAQAESDQDLPPGRYARFVDGANAFFLERAKADPVRFGSSSSHDTALCQRLAQLCGSDMSREEEYYYANDFQGRFLPIMGPRGSCPDPAWPQLHPDVERAVADVK